jgi:hypothetical protein
MNPECNHKLWNATQALVRFFLCKEIGETGLAKAPNKLELSWPTQLEIPRTTMAWQARRQGPEI